MTKPITLILKVCPVVIFVLGLAFMPAEISVTSATAASDGPSIANAFTPFAIENHSLNIVSTIAETIDSGTMRNSMRSCPIGQFIVGIDMDGNRLLCSNQPVVNSRAPYTDAFEIVDSSTFSQGLKACPAGYAMAGLSVVHKKVSCAHVGKMESTISSNTRRLSTNACPSGQVMVGFDGDSDRVLCGRRIDSCFGAIGSRCGITSEPFDTPFSLCVSNRCLTNAGSWDHDECCWQFPNGKLCRAPGAPHDGRCAAELSKAISRLSAGYNWRSDIDFNTQNTTGVVVRTTFCAPPGTIVHRNDVDRCCSNSSRQIASAFTDPIQAAADFAKATQQGISPTELSSANPRVCR